MILLSAHLDRVVQNYDLAFINNEHVGLLDNVAGVLLTYLTLYDDPNLLVLEKQGKIGVWHGKGEEWGLLENAPKLGKKDIALVIDVCSGEEYEGQDFALENFSGFSKKEVADMKDAMENQGFNVLCASHKWQNDPAKEDETWQWRAKGVRTLCFTIPIHAKDDGWHRIQCDNTVSAETMTLCRQGLKRLVNHLLG